MITGLPRVAFGLGLAALLGLFRAGTPEPSFAKTATDLDDLPTGVVREVELADGQIHAYRLDLDRLELGVGERFLVRLDQLGVDAGVEARWPGGSLRVDSPFGFDGIELLLLPSGTREAVELEIKALATTAKPGRYRLRVDPVEATDATSGALEAMTEAGKSYAEGGSEGRRRALDHYRRAVDLWRVLERPRLAAHSLYATAVLHRLLDEGAPALALARQVLPLWRSFGNTALEADTLNEIGLLEAAAGRVEEARETFGLALETQQRLGDPFRQAATANNLCLTYLYEGEHRRAIDCYSPALERIRAGRDEETEAVALTNLGWAHRILGQGEQALDHFSQAVVLHRAAGRDKREAETLNNLAVLHQDLAEWPRALELYLRALGTFREQGARGWEGRVLHNLGTCYHKLGDPERALVFYRQALVMRRELADLRGEANTLKALGRVALQAGTAGEAKELFRRALDLERRTEDRRDEAVVLGFVAEAEAALGSHHSALELFGESLAVLRELDNRPSQAWVLLRRGDLLLAMGRVEKALESLGSALELYRSLGLGKGEGEALVRLAEAERAAGRDGLARHRVDEAIEILESLSTRLGDPDLRASFGQSLADAYSLHIELSMARHNTEGDSESLRAAFEASERSRARGLVELLGQADADPLLAVGPVLGERHRAARRKLHALAARRRKLLAGTAEAAEVERSEVAFFQALAELEQVESEARAGDPRYAALTPSSPLSTEEIRRLLEPGTVLLEYALGPRRSFLFRLTHDSIRVFELPARRMIEESARHAYEELSSPHRENTETVRLAELLLAPALADLAADRLVIVADGMLHYLPFAALPVSMESARGQEPVPLLTRYEVVHLPSASMLVAQRRRYQNRPAASRWAAVLADPVFDGADRRLAMATAGRDGETSRMLEAGPGQVRGPADPRQPLDLELPRLRSSRREAEVIASLAAPGEVLVATDFDAERSLAVGGGLADYRIVHFATHGVIDARYPALSGLALSLYDRQGRPRDGFLRLRDIYALRLQAELVVLSACRTALGREVRGEGLVGLVRGFFHAGSRRVVASLWSVPDQATAELMGRFYRAMVEEQLAPAAALRRAQLSMSKERRWRDPHHWAGFVVLGDWH